MFLFSAIRGNAMDRRQFLRNGIRFFALAAVAAGAGTLSAAEPINFGRLMATLYPKTEGEKKYLKGVAALVKTKKIPEKLVYAAWRSAEGKQKNKRVRIFAETLTILCKQNNVPFTLKLTV